MSAEPEQSVVAQMLASPKTVGAVVDSGLLPEHFSTAAGRVLYEELFTAYLADDPTDAITIGTLTAKKLSALWEVQPEEAVERVRRLGTSKPPGKAADHASLVRRAAMYRDIADLARNVSDDVAKQEATPEEIAGLLVEGATRIATSAVRDNEWVSWDELGQRFEVQEKKLMAAVARGHELGAYFGLRFIDNFIRGLRPMEFMLLAGDPGAGKSHVVWKMAVKFAVSRYY